MQGSEILDSMLAWLLSGGVRILLILLLAVVARAAGAWLIRRVVRGVVDSGTALSSVTQHVVRRSRRDAEAAAKRREQRAATLGTVAVNILSAGVFIVTVIMILSEIGVDVGPLLASLGVVGLAAGIGAQTIIKDVIAGMVLLLEDIVAVGDWVDLEHAEGTVTNINLRVTQVRGLDGTLWTVRNGEIIRIGNKSRGYSTAVVLLDIDSQADNAVVSQVLDQVAQEISADEEWAPLLRDDVQISGILGVDGTRFRRRVMVKTDPGEQWSVEMELRRRIRVAFQRADIPFALPKYAETQQG
ncbi:mechanosensitive ion channel family protein [Brachybacterium sp. EF45031]|uniref:mechanosensitive ion channel family protein n=1 Tax=Brachybacterium sillae TaxID=2810536 RepID=UPI00217E225D|nr:mechanosensitive ion channel family protein [Brachybacterium sillae]MCS6712506.1 mechanosensitive ion channel family protein [Brachybacterium sillae]